MTNRRNQVLALMERHAVLGRMLPDPVDVEEVRARCDELRLVIREMRKIEAAIGKLAEAESRQ